MGFLKALLKKGDDKKRTIHSDLSWDNFEDIAFAIGCYVASMNHKGDDFSHCLFDGHVRGMITVAISDGGTIIFEIASFTSYPWSMVQSRVPKEIIDFLTHNIKNWEKGTTYMRENNELIKKEIYDMKYIMCPVGTAIQNIYRKIMKCIMEGVEAAKQYNPIVENIKYKESSFYSSMVTVYFAGENAEKVLE